ncbi:hypothetical protein [Ruminococcus flavefaciens]|uniref:hypothetical protein n=1 Tax=Ruminococcus flavefaciens TaxID=1265 RepID=UPI0004902E0D|nr:hypothetical protein [Ruminococcus flavefaciens]
MERKDLWRRCGNWVSLGHIIIGYTKGADNVEIYSDQDKRFISVWLTNEEQKHCDRKAHTAQLLKYADNPKCKVVYFLSGKDDLYQCTEGSLLRNLHLR